MLGGFWPGGPVCTVGFDDFARFAQLWLTGIHGDPGEIDRLDFSDLQYFTDYWLLSCPPDWALK